MRFFKKLFLVGLIFIVMILFLYGRQKNVSEYLQEQPNEQKEKIEETKCNLCIQKPQTEKYSQDTPYLQEQPNEQKEKVEETKYNLCIQKPQTEKYSQDTPICEKDLPKAYNASERIDTCKSFDFYATASFIYWEILEDQLDLGATLTTSITPNKIKTIQFPTDYTPGFKVGLGTHFNRDDWHIYAQYTRLHDTEHTTFIPIAGSTGDFYTQWYNKDTNVGTLEFVNIPDGVKAFWKMELDKIDLELGRAFCVGTNLITTPFIGISSHWMDQKYSLNVVDIVNGTYDTSTKNDSWAIGSRLGLETKWLFCKNFRLFGYGAFSLLFAQNDVSTFEISSILYDIEEIKINILRDVEELMIGIGWGSYLSNDKWHIDLSVAYETQRYSHTNYMSSFTQMHLLAVEVKPGDSFLHGLTVSARFDF